MKHSEPIQATLATFLELLVAWNRRLNLVADAAPAELWSRHVLDSLQVADYLPSGGGPIVDIGSGGGFPGLILAAVRPDRPTFLVESDKRKAAFLQEAARTLQLANVVVMPRRVEDIGVFADVITARALAPVPRLLELAAPRLQKGGVALFPKGRNVEAELTEALTHWTLRVERFPSYTAEHGVILRLSEISRRDPRS